MEKHISYVLSYCNQFTVTFSAGEYNVENPLMGGKNEFELLKDLVVQRSTEMDEGMVLRGKLTKDSVALFEEYKAPSYDGFKSVLWNFRLLKDNEPILEVSDFTVCLLYKSVPIERFLKKANIEINTLEN